MVLKMKEMGLKEGVWMPTSLLQMGTPCLRVPLCSTALSFKEDEPCSKAALPCNNEKMRPFLQTQHVIRLGSAGRARTAPFFTESQWPFFLSPAWRGDCSRCSGLPANCPPQVKHRCVLIDTPVVHGWILLASGLKAVYSQTSSSLIYVIKSEMHGE